VDGNGPIVDERSFSVHLGVRSGEEDDGLGEEDDGSGEEDDGLGEEDDGSGEEDDSS